MLTKLFFLATTLFSATAFADQALTLDQQVKNFGFGLTSQEMSPPVYKTTVKSGGNSIFEKKDTPYDYRKLVVSPVDKSEGNYLTTIYRGPLGTFSQYTKLNSKGQVEGQVQCKFQKELQNYTCEVQTSDVCHDLLSKVDSGTMGIDLNKVKECAEISKRISYSREGVEKFFDDSTEYLAAVQGGVKGLNIRAPATSLQTLLKDYAACKKVEPFLAPASAENAASSKAASTKKDTAPKTGHQ